MYSYISYIFNISSYIHTVSYIISIQYLLADIFAFVITTDSFSHFCLFPYLQIDNSLYVHGGGGGVKPEGGWWQMAAAGVGEEGA